MITGAASGFRDSDERGRKLLLFLGLAPSFLAASPLVARARVIRIAHSTISQRKITTSRSL